MRSLVSKHQEASTRVLQHSTVPVPVRVASCRLKMPGALWCWGWGGGWLVARISSRGRRHSQALPWSIPSSCADDAGMQTGHATCVPSTQAAAQSQTRTGHWPSVRAPLPAAAASQQPGLQACPGLSSCCTRRATCFTGPRWQAAPPPPPPPLVTGLPLVDDSRDGGTPAAWVWGLGFRVVGISHGTEHACTGLSSCCRTQAGHTQRPCCTDFSMHPPFPATMKIQSSNPEGTMEVSYGTVLHATQRGPEALHHRHTAQATRHATLLPTALQPAQRRLIPQ